MSRSHSSTPPCQYVSAHDQEGVKPRPDAQLLVWEIALRVIDMLPAGREYLVYKDEYDSNLNRAAFVRGMVIRGGDRPLSVQSAAGSCRASRDRAHRHDHRRLGFRVYRRIHCGS